MFGLSPIRRNDLSTNNNIWNIDKLFDNFFDDGFFPSYLNNRFGGNLNIDIKDEDDRYVIVADVPGIKKEEIKLDIDRDVLTISVERKEEVNEEKDNYLRRERRAYNLQRCFRLDNVKADEINAKLEEGILTLTLPKEEISKKHPRSIEIQ